MVVLWFQSPYPMTTYCLAALTLFASMPAAVAAPVDDAGVLLAQAKAASGGDTWDRVRSLEMKSTISQGGLTGTQVEWDDVATGASAVRYQLGPTSGRQGYDGRVVWEQDQSGLSRPVSGMDSRRAAVSAAYRSRLAYWFPARGAAVITRLGTQASSDRAFDVVHIAPTGGRAFDLWLDQQTHLIARTVEPGAGETTTTFFSEYRTVAGLSLPFFIRLNTGEAQYDQTTAVQGIVVNAPVRPALFHIPPPPPPDFAIAGGRASATVRFHFFDNLIYFDAKINSRGPFRTVLDSGATNIVDPPLAAWLRLKTQGALQGDGLGEKSVSVGVAPTRSLQIGTATLTRQIFYVYQLPAVGPPLHSLIGYELFKRFVVSIDYDRSRLTLTLPSHFRPPAGATAIAFRFNKETPEVDGSIDGCPGSFTLDTGSSGSVALTGPFVARNRLGSHYRHQVRALSRYGIGGPEYAQMTRAGAFTLGSNKGSVVVQHPVTDLSVSKAGAAADQVVAGNVGEGVLRQFNLVFDYAHRKLYFTPNAGYGKPDVFSRSGLSLLPQGSSWRVSYAIAGSPAAAAGLKVGDRVLTVNGNTAGQHPDLSALWHGAVGMRIPLVLQSGTGRRTVTLVLRNIL